MDLSGDPLFQQKLTTGLGALEALPPKLEAFSDALDAGDAELSIRAGADLLGTVKTAITALDAVAADLRRAAASTPLAASAASLSAELAGRLLEYALVCYLERSHPVVLTTLEVVAVVERTAVPVGSGATAGEVLRRRVYFDRLPQLINDPLAVLRSGYGWGTESLRLDLLLERLGRFLLAIGVLTGDVLDDDDKPTLGLDLFHLTVGTSVGRHPPGLVATLSASATDSATIPLFSPSPEWHLELALSGPFQEGLTLLLLPPARLELAGPFSPAPGGVSLRLRGEAADGVSPFVPLGVAGGSRLEAKRIETSVGGSFAADGSAGVTFDFQVKGGGLVLSSKGGDGFLTRVLPEDLRCDFDFGVTWSSERGFTFQGAAGLEATLPVGLSIGGVLKVPTIHLGLQAGDAGLQVEVSASVGLSIGPVQALVDRIGMTAAITFPEDGGNLGIADVSLGFKPPSGAGLAIDAAGVSGGGFLSFDPAKHEYAGVLQLEFNQLQLQAFGLITTQVAGGAGYSLLALIDADFPPVQLGWGFTLNGVGGLLAIHRSASVDALRAALKGGKLSTILFPKDAITNAPQILAALDSYFPTAPGRFLFGPMALIGWGTPTLITAAIAVIVELPEPVRILLLARIEARLPSPSSPLVRINMDALGVLDLGQGTLALDATLYDSKLLDFTLSGDMALRAAWSGQREFLLAVGGFHPRFTPPAGFPALQRIAIDMPSGAVSKLRLAAYLAITSNTVQFGAELDVFIGVSGFGLAGHLGFDALLQIDPFHFEADISGSVALTAGGDDLMSVGLDATLTGPAPWNIAGNFKVHLLFFTVHKSFSHSWGEDAPSLPPVTVDVSQLLRTALADPRSWSAQLPSGGAGAGRGAEDRGSQHGAGAPPGAAGGARADRAAGAGHHAFRRGGAFRREPVHGLRSARRPRRAGRGGAGRFRAGAVLRAERRGEAGPPLLRAARRGDAARRGAGGERIVGPQGRRVRNLLHRRAGRGGAHRCRQTGPAVVFHRRRPRAGLGGARREDADGRGPLPGAGRPRPGPGAGVRGGGRGHPGAGRTGRGDDV